MSHVRRLTSRSQRPCHADSAASSNSSGRSGSEAPDIGSVWYVDALCRDRSEVEGNVKVIKRVGLDG